MSLPTTASFQKCPNCGVSGQDWLESASKDSHVEYFRCKPCGHVWQVPKEGTPGEQRDVTDRDNH